MAPILGKRNDQIWLLGCYDMVILVIKASTLAPYYYTGLLVASLFFLIIDWNEKSVQYPLCRQLDSNQPGDYWIFVLSYACPRHLALEVFSNPSSNKLAMRGDAPEAQTLVPRDPTRPSRTRPKTRTLTLMRARSPHPRSPSRSQREGRDGRGERIPHLLGRRQVAARPHAPPHAQGPRHGSPMG